MLQKISALTKTCIHIAITLLTVLSVDVIAPDGAAAQVLPQQMEEPQAGQTFRDCPNCPEMVVIPPGSFIMGISPEDVAREKILDVFAKIEGPPHVVTVGHAFALGKYHVTRGEFASFVKETGYDAANGCFVRGEEHIALDLKRNWLDPGFAQTDRDPVVCVSYEDALQYVAWLNRKLNAEGRSTQGHVSGPYRLPSEAEWEYAARAGTTTERYWGDDIAKTCEYANGADLTARETIPNWPTRWLVSPCHDGYAYTSPVGSFKPNQFGLYDMLGNAAQMTADCWNIGYGGAPTDGGVWTTGNCQSHPVRGGTGLPCRKGFVSPVAQR
jgi:formylglycine-generating enzyme required for sulfatase activity